MLNLAIKASGMVTAAGFNSVATCAAIRAGVSGCQKDNIWDPLAGDYIEVGRPHTYQWWEGPTMLAELAAPAIEECFGGLAHGVDRSRVPIYVILSPETRPCRESTLPNLVKQNLEDRITHGHLHGYISGIYSGRDTLIDVLERIEEQFSKGTAQYAVVVGVDSFLRQSVVLEFMKRRRVLTQANSNGFIPGEAACAVLITPSQASLEGELRILGCGRGQEAGTIDGDMPATGDGLTQAVRGALNQAGRSLAEMQYWLTDQNAEHYKAKECTIVQIRLERRNQPAPRPFEVWHPIEFLGEIGSAIGPCLFGVALSAARSKYAPGKLALMHVGEDDGRRAAFVLEWAVRG